MYTLHMVSSAHCPRKAETFKMALTWARQVGHTFQGQGRSEKPGIAGVSPGGLRRSCPPHDLFQHTLLSEKRKERFNFLHRKLVKSQRNKLERKAKQRDSKKKKKKVKISRWRRKTVDLTN